MSFIPPISPQKYSRPVPAEFLEGYFPRTEARVSCQGHEEIREATEMYEDWLQRGGYECTLAVIPNLGAVIALTMPEAEPEKLVHISALSTFAFIEDDLYDGDIFSFAEFNNIKTDPKSRELLTKKFQNASNQLKAKLFYKLLENDNNENRYIQAYEEWAKSSTELIGKLADVEFGSLEEYMNERLDDVGASCYWNLMPIVHNFNFTDEDYRKLDLAEQLAYRLCILGNDLYSAEKEWIAYTSANKPGIPSSSLYIVMRINDISLGEAKEIVKQKWLDVEDAFLREQDRLMEENKFSPAASEYARYLSCLQSLGAGLVLFSIACPRYHFTPERNPLCPRPEQKIKDFPRKLGSHSKIKENGAVNGTLSTDVCPANGGHPLQNIYIHASSYSHSAGEALTIGSPKGRIMDGALEKSVDKAPWLSKHPKLSDEVTIQPSNYIKSMPSKGIRNVAIDALDLWYTVPQQSLEIIKNIISMLHTSSLIIDDIEDGSDLRRGQPSTHMVFGIPQSINAANYLFVKCIFEAQKLSPSAVAIFEDELRNLHIGQGLDLHWTFHQRCPSEAEYIQMIDGKTGGLFRMASRLMRDQATQNQDLEVEDLLTLMGRFFQIRDDYQNLGSVDYARAKGSLSDLDEGKYSFMLIHALKNQSQNHQLKCLLQMRSQKGQLTKEQKDLIMKIMRRSKSMEYTAMVLEELRLEIEVKLEYIEAQLVERGFKEDKNWMIRAIMARLRLPDPITKSLIK
ncbi:hypothetical protein TWF506_000326 [Arthrobotrys conoides]|uniref:Uncharacterized protein n=1 Tax=Arthrobotrys conoides TaxID=74498 RepID=A0AAN8S462_9PEZI